MKYPQPYAYIFQTLRLYMQTIKDVASDPKITDRPYTKGLERISKELKKAGQDPETFIKLCTEKAEEYYGTYTDETSMSYIEFYSEDAGIRRAAKILKDKYPHLQDLCTFTKEKFVPEMRKMHISLTTCISILLLMQKQNLTLKHCNQDEMTTYITILDSTL